MLAGMTSTDTALQRALDRERAHHDRCRTVLAAMVEGAQEHVVTGEDVSASGADAEVLGYRLRSRAKEMRELPAGPLFFGRLDFAEGEEGERALHIGRLRITEHPAAPPLVVDWRAPVSRAFYQATAGDPRGVAVRRRFGWAPGSRGERADLTGMEDEHLARGESRAGAIVAREIERPRVGPMRDIAATIQPEQDDLVRAGLGTTVCVQGAPGTGKTAVGLHRAAYLLYTHPQRVQRGGLLILGPNPTFLSYIAEVLPALGESGVRQSTLAREIARHPVTRTDDARAAALKHDARAAEVLRRALYARVDPGAAGDLTVPDGSYRWRVPAEALARIVADVRREQPPYTVGRERVRARIVRYVQERAERRAGPRTSAWLRRVERARPVGAALDAVWPRVCPEEVLAPLLGDPDELAGAADGVLDDDEQRALLWTGGPRGPGSRPAGPPPTWSCSTSSPASSNTPRATATSSSTRPRTSPRWSAGPSPAGPPSVRSPSSATSPRGPRRGPRGPGGPSSPTCSPGRGRGAADHRVPGAEEGRGPHQPAAGAARRGRARGPFAARRRRADAATPPRRPGDGPRAAAERAGPATASPPAKAVVPVSGSSRTPRPWR
ncbi:hypothetical protein STENM327S_02557 [Streptomyces tendae]